MAEMTNTERRRLADYLHTANVAMFNARGIGLAGNRKRADELYASARDLINRVVETLLDHPGCTDFYDNPTTVK